MIWLYIFDRPDGNLSTTSLRHLIEVANFSSISCNVIFTHNIVPFASETGFSLSIPFSSSSMFEMHLIRSNPWSTIFAISSCICPGPISISRGFREP